ncbi:hypothetical protein P9257_05085 [Bacillus velezensis]|uniref:hypothetical protein n=1 Tax=Bacillus velezensis TaxID=492670 RepID=UPI002E236063|nr:hypothetical protein [Bacillus velezensis]
MAKLNGVKTLDMVNGEITKVAYGGAEYERVEGGAEEFGNVGDLVLNGRIHCDLTVGAFYEIVIHEDYGWKTVRDDVGDWHSDVLCHSRSALFRKVSASTGPSLEDRVSSAEADLESLKSDVAALKGEAGYVRIDKSEARAGDYVKFIETDDEDITVGKRYEIAAVDCDDDLVFTDDLGQENYAQSDDAYEVYRKVSAASVEAERLKVGDYAKAVREEFGHQFDTDDILELIGEGYRPNFAARRLLDGEVWYVDASEVVRATDEEVAEAKDAAARAKFKEGAKVRLKSGGGDYPLGGFTDGNIYEVSDNAYNHRRGTLIRIEGGDCFRGSGFAAPDQLEILTEEKAAEIERKQAEEAKWAKIGRKVGEYKKGDIAKLTIRSGDIFFGEITGLRGGNYYGFKHLHAKYGTTSENTRDLTLITPVEARFDR